QLGVVALRVGGADARLVVRIAPELRVLRLDVRLALHGRVLRGAGLGAARVRVHVAAVTIDAAEIHLTRDVHRLDAVVTGEAAGALGVGLGLRLSQHLRRAVGDAADTGLAVPWNRVGL